MTTDAGYLGASEAAIRSHYDVGNDFYALWLDPSLTYSCALWEDPHGTGGTDTLDAAQQRKHDLLIEGTRAAGRERVLDVGSGWGALLRRLVERHEVRQVVGLTLSRAQAEAVGAWADDRYEIRVENWVDHRPEEHYDAIISIGAFEHFADMGLRRHERVAAYRDFFLRCRDWLPPGGRLGLQSMLKGNNTRMGRQTVRDLLFMIDRIFPESELPWLSEIFEASERLLDVVWVRNDADHYARTCREWNRRMLAQRERAEELVGADVVADYERYLNAAADAFTKRHFGLGRLIFERV
ncbi:cyclopropane-fatty-acyl-phospholipid synthase family protein [Nocardia sp. CDC159]|uniref:Cyclopropane-fatty-acyl-phospholipid synthase family protein n=1 Tax=Nocardia pulmonis TaxID=2951408 RepID=A0A9X2J2C1_9NOCA|nr:MULTISPECIES: cyclopropane-fatty-acyl-phospholipid synthase family protein [Nocardia]MCM6779020.1 cyclopropane-fatty-acyl-phospholipid synthase family protein [Nocardia pulmonis]MCM6791910.1 cyclopropane-fatty-acyl-phospholipid synthase family protein [Nocardia sp. CDC159]